MGAGQKRDEVIALQRGLGYDEGWIAQNATVVDDDPGLVVKAAPGVGKRLCITDIVVTNTGSGTGIWELRETGLTGAVVWRGVLAAGNTNATNQVINFCKPLVLGENKSLFLFGVANHALFATVNGFTAKTVDLR